MRHLKSGRKLGRNAAHRTAMKRNMALALLACERIVTTVAKAKEIRGYVERLITLAKRGGLHARRLLLARLGGVSVYVRTIDREKEERVDVIRKLFDTLAPRYANRPGGYTRVTKQSYVRLGDAAPTAIVELLKEGETKEPRQPAAPAPVSAPAPDTAAPPPAPAPEAPQAQTPPEAETPPAAPPAAT